MIIEDMPYRVGGLLYTPAVNEKISTHLRDGSMAGLTSLAMCLEDSITDDILEEAEENLKKTLGDLKGADNLPLLFVRIRTPEHMLHVFGMLGDDAEILTGFVLPKFNLENAENFFRATEKINSLMSKRMYIMPTIESPVFTSADGGRKLEELKDYIDSFRKYVLNIRVGGNDFLNIYGLRREITQNIYQVGVVRDVLVKILNVFSGEYVVSGAVWEYYDNGTGDDWKRGLEKELELDRLNGFIGKTAIHPSQVPVICESLRPYRHDFEDAEKILSWNERLGVCSGGNGNRMIEVRTHMKWAERVSALGRIYGVKE